MIHYSNLDFNKYTYEATATHRKRETKKGRERVSASKEKQTEENDEKIGKHYPIYDYGLDRSCACMSFVLWFARAHITTKIASREPYFGECFVNVNACRIYEKNETKTASV